MKKLYLPLLVLSGASLLTYSWFAAAPDAGDEGVKAGATAHKAGKVAGVAPGAAGAQGSQMPATPAGQAQVPSAGVNGPVGAGGGAATSQVVATPTISMPPAAGSSAALAAGAGSAQGQRMIRMEDFNPEKALASGNWYHPDLPEDQVRARMVEYLSNKAMAEKRRAVNWAKEAGMPVRTELPGGGVSEIMSLDADGTPVYYTTNNVQLAKSLQTDLVRNTSPYSVNGSNGTGRFNIGEWDGGSARATHASLKGRVTQKEGTITLSDHSTHVAGTMIASDFYPGLQGMAPSAGVLSYDFNNDLAEMTAEAQTTAALGAKVLVSNHSYGANCGWVGNQYWGNWLELEDRKFGRYEAKSVLIDSLCLNSPYYQPFFSAGNDRNNTAPNTGGTFQRFHATTGGVIFQNNAQVYNPATHPGSDFQKGGYDTIPSFSGSKNVITVGAVTDALDSAGNRSLAASSIAQFSGWGPTDDGRIKPDIVAVGVNVLSASSAGDNMQTSMNGTSMATPGACGSAILLQELYADNFSGVAMRASTLKALILHSADDMGAAGPDYTFGWGMMNTKRAADVIRAHKGSPINNHMMEDALTTTEPSKSYSFAWNGIGPIRVTICWTDPAGTAELGLNTTTAKLVNDLDLRVTGPGGTTMPYILDPANPGTAATRGDNVRDNVEQVYIEAPTSGTYTVTVNHKGTLNDVNGRQNFSLVHEGLRSDAPVIRLSSQLLTFTTSPSSSPDFYSFTLQNVGVKPLNYSISDNASWLHVNPTSGSANNGETDTIFLGFTTTTLVSGVYTGRVFVTAPGAAPAELEVRLTVTGNTVPLAQAIDVVDAVSSSGSAPWFGQTAMAHDSVDAARSAPVKDNLDTAFSLTVQGPGELTYWWKVDSEATDKLKFEIGTTPKHEISGNQDWAQMTVAIPAGSQKLTWRYKKDGSTSSGADAGWVDEIRYVQNTARLTLSQNRVDLVTPLGQNPVPFSFNVLNEGDGTLDYTVSSSKSWATVSADSGSTSGEPDPITVTIDVAKLKAGLNSARVTVKANGVSEYFDINLTVLPGASVPLHTAVDYGTNTSWNSFTMPTNPSAAWFGQAADAFDKTDCARSGTGVADNGVSILSLATVTGPCAVSFYWRTDCEAGYDRLAFFDGATEVTSISGQDPSWKQFTYNAGSGTHNICWQYIKDGSQSRGLDCGFVDKIVLDFKAPKLQVSTSLLLGTGIAGGSPGGPSFQISNTGAGTLNYVISADQTWIKPAVTKGTAMAETDTIGVSFDARSLSPGVHYGAITVTGASAGSHTIGVSLTLGASTAPAVSFESGKAYLQAFSKTTLPTAAEGWGFYSSDEGRISIVAGALRMDDKVTGSLHSLNEAILNVNLAGKTGVMMSFSYRQSNEEPHPMPESYTGHYNGDGVSISADGITWYTVDHLLNTDGNATIRIVDLDAAATLAGLTYNSSFKIKFQQYDDCPWGSDGAEFDALFVAAVTQDDDHGNRFDRATVISPGSSTNGKIEVAGDQDMFCFTLAQQSAFTIVTTGGTDTYGELYDGGGNLMLSNNDGVGKNFLISRTLDPGTYYVSVRGNNGAKGLYTLVTNSRVNAAVPSLTLPPDDWAIQTMNPFIPTGPGVSYAMSASGLLQHGHGETLVVNGAMNVKVTGNRSFSGKVTWEGVAHPVTGAFDAGDTGIATGTVTRKNASSLSYMLRYHSRNGAESEWRLIGTVTDGVTTETAILLEDYNWNAQALVGTYSIAVPGVNNGSTLEPQGAGYGTLTVSKTGDAILAMTLPDNTTCSLAIPVTNVAAGGQPEISFYMPIGTGFFAGEMQFRDIADTSDLDGRVSWRKPADSKNTYYPSGFHLNRRILGSKFVPVAAGATPQIGQDLQLKPNVTSAIAKFFGSDLPYIPGNLRLVSWTNQDKLSSQFTGETWTYSYTPSKVLISGSYKHAATLTTGNFGGVILQKQRKVAGFLKGNFQTGLFYMEP
ncbi:S8 family serine peptidase [Brevifollis gellanilyticus]|nr:S8 family serine peptidase [Brevifollis gellanilyticus]